MTQHQVDNINIASQEVLITPRALKKELPASKQVEALIEDSRSVLQDILRKKDHRLFIVVGPCSIHDTKAAIDYANRLKILSDELNDSLYIVMRVYFEKPRTTIGWKGLINDPYLDDSFRIEEGLHLGRKLLLDIAEIGLPTSTEALDPISPQYLQDLISWSAIGARTTESQTHREMASGLSCPVGFKNGTDGGLTVAINAIQSAEKPHNFLGMNKEGQVAITTTTGNPHSHIVLRGGSEGPNYDSVHVKLCEQALEKAGLAQNIMIDCSHANSNKQPDLQPLVVDNIASQILEDNRSIVGLMIESNIESGNQSLSAGKDKLAYGVSITDGCIGWKETEDALRLLAGKVGEKLKGRC